MRRLCPLAALLACAPTTATVDDNDGGDGTAMPGSTSSADATTATSAPPVTSTSGTTEVPGDASSSSSSSSSGGVFTGPGCAPPPPCDRGEYVGSISIQSADQIDDIAGFTSITGWLEVRDSDLECLSFLGCMEEVGHDFHIFNNAALRDVDGTHAIERLGTFTEDEVGFGQDGSLLISQNASLTHIDGFNALVEAQQSLVISSNDALESVAGFEALMGTRRDLVITRNASLADLDGLEEILYLGGDCQITNNPSLCMSETFAVCGDLKQGPGGGQTVNNLPGC